MTTPQDCAIGIAKESTYGTYATVSRFVEFTSESFDVEKVIKQGSGLRKLARLARSSRRALVAKDVVGDLEWEVLSKGHGLLFEAMLGTGASNNVADTTYQQLFTIGDLPTALSIQKQIPQTDNSTITHYTFVGNMVNSWELSCENEGILMAKASVMGQATSSQSAETVSYVSSPSQFHFAHGTVALGGTLTMPTTTALGSTDSPTAANVRSFSITGDNKLIKRRNYGNSGLMSQPRKSGVVEIKAKMTIEFDSTTWTTAYLADTSLSALLTFDTGVALSTGNETFQIAIKDMRPNGEIPKANGGELVTMDVEFDVLWDDSSTPFAIAVRTADTAL